LPSSTHVSISDGVMSNARLASATVVLPWMIYSTSADFRRAVQRLISSSITALMVSPRSKVTPEQEFTGSLQSFPTSASSGRTRKAVMLHPSPPSRSKSATERRYSS
jgi:hypothetical protein